MDPMVIIIAGSVLAGLALLVTGALIHRSGVRQGLKMFRITQNIERGIDPLDEPRPMAPADPDEPPEETV